MRQLIYIITFIFLFLSACKPDCSHHRLTVEEESFLPDIQGQSFFFKNDSSGEIDTMVLKEKRYSEMEIDGCKGIRNGVWQDLDFPVLTEDSGWGFSRLEIMVNHYHKLPTISLLHYEGSEFNVGLPPQTLTVNGVTYTDVYSAEIDSTKIERIKTPWKVDYSKSQGIIRIHMLNGVHWNRE